MCQQYWGDKMLKFFSVLCIFILFTLINIDIASACSCINQPSVYDSFRDTPIIFVGQVDSIKEEKVKIIRFGEKEEIRTGLTAYFTVKESLKGISESKVEVITGGGGGDCGFHFEKGETYIVFAWPNKTGDRDDSKRISSTHIGGSGVKISSNTLSTSICSRTRPLSYGETDLELIHALLNGNPDRRIYGKVFESSEEFCQQGTCFPKNRDVIKEVTITAISSESSYETKTNEKGLFQFVNMVPGEYKIRVKFPTDYAMFYDFDRPEQTILVKHTSFSYETYFNLGIDNRISGRVFNGQVPVGKQVEVTLIRVGQANKDIAEIPKLHEYTDEQGYYAFSKIPAGQYLLGICIADVPTNNTPYKKIYYPKSDSPSLAQVINLEKGQKITDLNFYMSERLSTFKISGVVKNKKGKLISGAEVNLYDLEDPSSPVWGVDVKTDAHGRFSITAFKGRNYQLHAYKDKDYLVGTGMQSNPQNVNDKKLKGVTLILNKPGIFLEQLK